MREAAPFACQFLWPFEPHFDSRKSLHGSLLGFQLEISVGRASALCTLFITGNVNFSHGVWALLCGSRVVRWCETQGSCKREPPAFEHSDWLGLPVWLVVAHVQKCCRAVAWMLEQVIFSPTSWTELARHQP